MKHLAKLMLLTLGIGVVAVVLLSLPRHTAAAAGDPPSLPVNVTNTPNVHVTNTPSVNANITNAAVPVTGSVTAVVTGTVNANVPSPLPVSGNVTITPPALTSVVNIDDPGRIAYQSTVNNVGLCSGSLCTFTFGPVPSGHRVVVQHINAYFSFSPAPTTTLLVVQPPSPAVAVQLIFAPPPNGLSVGVDAPALFYMDSGQSFSINVTAAGGGGTFLGSDYTQLMTLTGYEVNCSTAPCAAIASQ